MFWVKEFLTFCLSPIFSGNIFATDISLNEYRQ